MSMSHKAFGFNWHGFYSELAPLLTSSLTDDDPEPLIDFGNTKLSFLSDPYEGVPLTSGWIGEMEVGDVQEIADYVLTKYYNPKADRGVGVLWLEVEDSLTGPQRAALLGQTFGPQSKQFDPGRIGSYFQDEVMTQMSLSILDSASRPELRQFLDLLREAVHSGNGIYVTF